MATVSWGSTKSVNPVQGSMRQYLVRNRIDLYTASLSMLSTDTNKVMIIAAGWNVHKVWVKLITKGITNATTLTVEDSATTTWIAAGKAIGTGGTNGTLFETAHSDGYGSDNYAGGHIYSTADYLQFVLNTTCVYGICDVYALVSDLNIDENAASWTD